MDWISYLCSSDLFLKVDLGRLAHCHAQLKRAVTGGLHRRRELALCLDRRLETDISGRPGSGRFTHPVNAPGTLRRCRSAERRRVTLLLCARLSFGRQVLDYSEPIAPPAHVVDRGRHGVADFTNGLAVFLECEGDSFLLVPDRDG